MWQGGALFPPCSRGGGFPPLVAGGGGAKKTFVLVVFGSMGPGIGDNDSTQPWGSGPPVPPHRLDLGDCWV